jgi:hypothetical protein
MRGSQLRPSSSDERLLRMTTALFVKPRLNQPCTFFGIAPVFDRCGSHLEWTFHRVKSLAIDLHFSLPQQRDKPNKTNFLLGWTPPPLGFFKLNTDGSAQGNPGFACAEGLIRDSAGRWIRGFSHSIGFTTSLAADEVNCPLQDGCQNIRSS